MPRIIWDEQAGQDLRDYAHYLGIERQSPQGALSLVRAIEDASRMIAQNPLMGEARPELGNELRVFSCGAKSNPRGYVLIYRPKEDGIEVVRVFRGSQDYPNLLP